MKRNSHTEYDDSWDRVGMKRDTSFLFRLANYEWFSVVGSLSPAHQNTTKSSKAKWKQSWKRIDTRKDWEGEDGIRERWDVTIAMR
jgi:hypothetical protein